LWKKLVKFNFKNVTKNDKINNTRVNMLFTFVGAVLPLSGMETMDSSTKMTIALYLLLPTNLRLIICDHLPQETWSHVNTILFLLHSAGRGQILQQFTHIQPILQVAVN
jgi:glycine cleavage system regulatory protein